MSLWWLESGWTEARCARCGRKIWPEGDPDHGVCYDCYFANQPQQYPEPEYPEEPFDEESALGQEVDRG